MDIYDSLSPLDYRYYCSKEVFDKLQPYLSENASIKYQAKAETALAYALAENGICSMENAKEIEKAARAVTASEVYEEDARIKHNIRALVNCIRKKVSSNSKPFVHFTATSNDIVSTAESLRIKDAVENALIPELILLEETLIRLAEREKDTLQIGRTHGQHAEPITFGFAISSYVSRLGSRIESIRSSCQNLKGKFSGAVGAYNASSLLIDDPEEFEKKILESLGMTPGISSNQLVEAEYVTDLLHSVVSAMSVMANIADDMRHLQRSEIMEVYELFEKDQVGSSTMPHKRNPINFENVKSMWKAFMPRMTSVYMDQISEHQRDLTNSASSRFNSEMIAVAFMMASRLRKVMANLQVDKASLKKNFEKNKDLVSAEPAYVLLASAGHPNAHEAIRKITLKAEKSEKSFMDLLLEDESLKSYFSKMSEDQISVLKNPESYLGLSSEKTQKICSYWRNALDLK